VVIIAKKDKLIAHTGGHKKVVINLELAKVALSDVQLKKLNELMVELNDVQERRERG
jgi:hypothetical protein